jgi:hypothetical protein
MQKIELSEIRNLVEYEKVRDEARRRIIELKRNRRVSVGPNLTLLFENRETVLFQIHEMVRTERIVDDAKIQEEVIAYNALIPDPGELSATLFIELPELIHMSQEQVRVTVNRFQGLDRGGVTLQIGSHAMPARFEEGHSSEEKMAAVHYIRFAVPDEAATLLSTGAPVRLVVDHPSYQADADVPPAVSAELAKDLGQDS